mgnify:CR=1 FL=1
MGVLKITNKKFIITIVLVIGSSFLLGIILSLVILNSLSKVSSNEIASNNIKIISESTFENTNPITTSTSTSSPHPSSNEINDGFFKMVIQPQFDDIESFSEGLACVKVGEDESGRWGYINKTGEYVIEPKYYYAKSFSEGLAAVQETKDGKDGYIDLHGNYIIEPQFDYGYSFNEGYAIIFNRGEEGLLYSYIDKKGKYLISPIKDLLFDFHEGYGLNEFRLINQNKNMYTFIRKDGTGTPPYFAQEMYPFSDGMALFRLDDKYGYLNNKGNVQILNDYYRATDFENGIALVYDKNFFNNEINYKIINKYGAVLEEGAIDNVWLVYGFYDGFARFRTLDDKSIFIDKKNNIVLDTDYVVSDFENGYAIATVDRKKGLLDKAGKFVVEAIYDDIKNINEGMVGVKINNKWGFLRK